MLMQTLQLLVAARLESEPVMTVVIITDSIVWVLAAGKIHLQLSPFLPSPVSKTCTSDSLRVETS